MKISITSQEIKITIYTVSTSLLLCSAMEVQAASADDESIPWYRQDVPAFTLPTPDSMFTGRYTTNPTLDTHPLTVYEAAPAAWERVYGQASRQAETDYLTSQSSGNVDGLLKGPALYTVQNDSGHTQRVGLLGGQSQFQTNSNGIVITRAMAAPRNDSLDLQGSSLGAYWSLTGSQGWHVDLTASGGRVNGYSRTDQGARQATEGSAVTLSVEGGFPIGINENWVVEPQAQLINQRISLDTPNAGSGNYSSSDLTSWSGRVGARLKGNYQISGLPIEPYVRTDLWHTVNSTDTLTLGQVDKISNSRNSSTVELGLGLIAKVSPTVNLYMSADYSSDVDTNALNGLIGVLGVQMRW